MEIVIENLVKTHHFGKNSHFSKTNRCFAQKVLSKMEFFVKHLPQKTFPKNRKFLQNPNLPQKSKFWPKIETFVKNRNPLQNQNFRQKCKILI